MAGLAILREKSHSTTTLSEHARSKPLHRCPSVRVCVPESQAETSVSAMFPSSWPIFPSSWYFHLCDKFFVQAFSARSSAVSFLAPKKKGETMLRASGREMGRKRKTKGKSENCAPRGALAAHLVKWSATAKRRNIAKSNTPAAPGEWRTWKPPEPASKRAASKS